MLLTIDIGNTNITYGLFKGKFLLRQGKIPTAHKNYSKYLAKLPWNKIRDVIISSVVPASLERLKRALRKKFSGKLLVLGENISVPIKNLYQRPDEVGQDRLVNAYAGYQIYGEGLIIVDFGTAVTFDVVSRKGEYLGGMIFPGLRTSLEALCQRAALLPKKMALLPPARLIGKSTRGSICSGIYYGFIGLTRGIIELLKEEQGRDLKVIVTGGDARNLYPSLRGTGLLKPDLNLEGLRLVYENRRKREK